MRKWKAAVLAVAVILVLVVLFQNRAAVETRILFVTVTMPRSLLLLVTLLVGFGGGVITGARMGKSPAKS